MFLSDKKKAITSAAYIKTTQYKKVYKICKPLHSFHLSFTQCFHTKGVGSNPQSGCVVFTCSACVYVGSL